MKKENGKVKRFKRLKLTLLHPNDWNPNFQDTETYKKLKAVLKRSLAINPKRIPPVVVRPSKVHDGQYEIIDGYHRWKALDELKQTHINAFIADVDDTTARLWTDSLNYLKGTPDREKYAKGLVELLEMGATTEEILVHLPENEEEFDQLITEADISVEAIQKLEEADRLEEERHKDDPEENVWVEIKTKVTVAQAKIIEQELARIGKAIKGKNSRGRAMELMAVQSSQVDLPEELTT